VPLEDAELKTALEGAESEAVLKQILDGWLYRRDLYKWNFPVSGRKFFGREQELAELIRNVDSGNHVGIFGLRKVGKTSLLLQLKETRREDLVVHVDLQNIPAGIKDCAYVYWEIANQLEAELQKKYPQAAESVRFRLGGKYRSFAEIPNREMVAADFDSDLRFIHASISSFPGVAAVKVLLLLDEIEKMLPISDKSEGFKGYVDFFGYLRGVSQQTGFLVSVVAAANPAICEEPQWEGRDNPVFKFYQEIFLPPFEKNECDEMIEKLGKGMGIAYNPSSLQKIYEETGGHPFVARQLCSRIASKFQERPLAVDDAKVDEAAKEFLFQDASTFQEILERLERDFPEEKDVLLFIAEGLNTEKELSSLFKSRVEDSLRHLVGYQLLERDGDKYRIKMGLLLKWIQRHWLHLEG